MPQSFEDRFRKLTKKHYIYNIRGHDYLSFMAQSTTTKNEAGPLTTNAVIYGEIDALRILAQQDAAKFNQQADIITSFGPKAGSFFADPYRLAYYRWSNLPSDLEGAIQMHVSMYGYGNQKSFQDNRIHDVAVNANGGWIMQLKRGSQFEWSREGLPSELQRALADGVRKKRTISVLELPLLNRWCSC